MGDGDGGDWEVGSCWMRSEMKEDDGVMQVRGGCVWRWEGQTSSPSWSTLDPRVRLFDTVSFSHFFSLLPFSFVVFHINKHIVF